MAYSMLLNIMEAVTKSDGSSHVEEAMADAIKQGTIIIREAKEILVAPSLGRGANYWLLHLYGSRRKILVTPSMGRGAVTESDALDGISEQSKKRENPTGRRWKQSVNSRSINLSTKSDGCSLQMIRKYSKKL